MTPERLVEIRLLGDPVLRRVTQPWSGDPRELVWRLERIMRAANGIGLAAPQIGESVRVAVIDVGNGRILELINPRIVWASLDTSTEHEGCLSIPGYEVGITRSASVTIDCGAVTLTLTGIQARAAQHEIDHLDGVLILDRWLQQKQAEIDALTREREQSENQVYESRHDRDVWHAVKRAHVLIKSGLAGRNYGDKADVWERVWQDITEAERVLAETEPKEGT